MDSQGTIMRREHAALVQPRPKGLLLDFGAVISVSVFERHRETEVELGLPAGSLTWLGPLAPATDPLWQSMQRDEISERDYWATRARELGASVGEPDWDVLAMLTRIRQVDPNDVVRPAISCLVHRARAAGIAVGILSNELELFYGKHFLERMDILQDMAMIIDATHTNILKPDPRAYALAIEALRLAPEEILFVDDQFRNIVGGVKAGLQTQHFDLRDIDGSIAAVAARLQLPWKERA
jgi:putative hydrolase of the HAD superfamily